MSILKSWWLASALCLLAASAIVLSLGLSGLPGVITGLVAGGAAILIARHFSTVPEPSISQSIQRELR